MFFRCRYTRMAQFLFIFSTPPLPVGWPHSPPYCPSSAGIHPVCLRVCKEVSLYMLCAFGSRALSLAAYLAARLSDAAASFWGRGQGVGQLVFMHPCSEPVEPPSSPAYVSRLLIIAVFFFDVPTSLSTVLTSNFMAHCAQAYNVVSAPKNHETRKQACSITSVSVRRGKACERCTLISSSAIPPAFGPPEEAHPGLIPLIPLGVSVLFFAPP